MVRKPLIGGEFRNFSTGGGRQEKGLGSASMPPVGPGRSPKVTEFQVLGHISMKLDWGGGGVRPALQKVPISDNTCS